MRKVFLAKLTFVFSLREDKLVDENSDWAPQTDTLNTLLCTVR